MKSSPLIKLQVNIPAIYHALTYGPYTMTIPGNIKVILIKEYGSYMLTIENYKLLISFKETVCYDEPRTIMMLNRCRTL